MITATWAMVYLICTNGCTAQYAVSYNTRAECIRDIPKQQGTAKFEKYICIPISKD
jgi:hypothetical protein